MQAAIRDESDQTPAAQVAATSLDFHTALVCASHNSALLTMFRATRVLIQEAFGALHASQPDMAVAAKTAHALLYDAIQNRDGDRAVRVMREHLYEFAERVDRARKTPGEQAGSRRFV